MTYHAGELLIQTRVGVQAAADRLQKLIGSVVSPAAQDFLKPQQWAIASTVDQNHQVWASLLIGEAGFLTGNDRSIHIHAVESDDPLWESQSDQQSDQLMGLLAIDLATRRRLRINGSIQRTPQGIHLYVNQVYFNCPKYIQMRQLIGMSEEMSETNQTAQWSDFLDLKQQQLIAQADTFFIASLHPTHGADASHRGGQPGFVKVLQPDRLLFPDYAGNNMFNTLGNIAVNPNVGLLFINFVTGETLQLTGRAQIIWDADSEFVGAERLIEVQLDRIRATTIPLRWQFVEYSPANPA
ncbi:pyridoxamine 5'-phosphate oxidase family protein [Phormidesmis sp. 146-12]